MKGATQGEVKGRTGPEGNINLDNVEVESNNKALTRQLTSQPKGMELDLRMESRSKLHARKGKERAATKPI